MQEFIKALNKHFYESGSYLETLDRERPYDGQPHTDLGERGKQIVSGVTMRDIRDACIRAFFLSSGLPKDEYTETVFDLDLGNMDPVAVTQNLTCEIEKMMRIYPNLPSLKST